MRATASAAEPATLTKQTASTASARLATLEERIGHRFADGRLLELALTHSSWCAENDGESSNERLEFLGDAVLGLAAAHRLYGDARCLTEGQMSKARAAVVSGAALAEVGRRLGLGALLRLGRGEESSGARGNPSLLANALEAVIGAVYLDGGPSSADIVIGRLMGRRLRNAARTPGGADFKTRLQELAAGAGLAPPRYKVTASGPEHLKRFRVSVSAGSAGGVGEGSTKKGAAQRAAKAACRALSKRMSSSGTGAGAAARAAA